MDKRHKTSILLANQGGIDPALYTNLVAYWKLDETSAGSAPVARVDSVGGLSLTDNNTVASATGKLGNAASFVIAESTNLSIADNETLSMGDVDMSIACWVNPAAGTGAYQFIACKYTAAVGRREYYLAMNTSNIFEFAVRNTGDSTNATVAATTFGAPTAGTWYFICGTHDSTANKIYISVNATSRQETETTGGILDSTSSFRIGSSDQPGGYFGGLVDTVMIWKGGTLTATQEAYLYNGGSGRALY